MHYSIVFTVFALAATTTLAAPPTSGHALAPRKIVRNCFDRSAMYDSTCEEGGGGLVCKGRANICEAGDVETISEAAAAHNDATCKDKTAGQPCEFMKTCNCG